MKSPTAQLINSAAHQHEITNSEAPQQRSSLTRSKTMHELGIVFYIIKDVKQVAEEHHVEHVSTVVMDIGEVSTVVPHLLTDCWRWAADKEDMLRGCEMKVNIIPAVTWCDNCKKEYETVKFGKTCPHCNSGNTWLLRGNEVEINSVVSECW
jgi:hydrogenase nickel incorporation protein HypA/HybF